jgi:hypothetical protein
MGQKWFSLRGLPVGIPILGAGVDSGTGTVANGPHTRLHKENLFSHVVYIHLNPSTLFRSTGAVEYRDG